jgi:hypothetical protein
MDPRSSVDQRSSVDVVDLLKYVGSPIAVGAALLFYFGWVRSNEQALLFGADISVFEMSAEDLVLRSVNVVFLAGLILVIAGLVFLRLQPWIHAHAAQVSRVLLRSWVLVPIGLLLLLVPGVGELLLPFFVLLAVAGVAYGARLRRVARGEGSPPLVQDLLVGALLIVVLFWTTERVARGVGDVMTWAWQACLDKGPTLSLLSERPLHLARPGVSEVALQGVDGTYTYMYEGLHLLQRSGEKYFLATNVRNEKNQWAGQLIVLPDDNTIRLEFSPPPTPAPGSSPSPSNCPQQGD